MTGADVIAETLIGGPGAPPVVVRGGSEKSIATRGPDGTWTAPALLVGLEGARSQSISGTLPTHPGGERKRNAAGDRTSALSGSVELQIPARRDKWGAGERQVGDLDRGEVQSDVLEQW